MPIMTRMRESMPIILFGLLIAFLITIIFEWGMDYLGMSGGRQDIVGSVDGQKITYKDFSELLKTAQRPTEGADRQRARRKSDQSSCASRSGRRSSPSILWKKRSTGWD